MKISELKLKDQFIPFEKVLKLIREKKLRDATVIFSQDGVDEIFYAVEGVIDDGINDDAVLKALGLTE